MFSAVLAFQGVAVVDNMLVADDNSDEVLIRGLPV
jgi:hypothetical protein